jgi:hypothetical protein
MARKPRKTPRQEEKEAYLKNLENLTEAEIMKEQSRLLEVQKQLEDDFKKQKTSLRDAINETRKRLGFMVERLQELRKEEKIKAANEAFKTEDKLKEAEKKEQPQKAMPE